MSKRVEVREGDRWEVFAEELYQIRGEKERVVVSNDKVYVEVWGDTYETSGESLPAPVARAWIESLGGEWAEVAEEKPATTTTKTLHLYAGPSTPASVFMYDGKLEQVSPGMKYLGTHTITIAGVTT